MDESVDRSNATYLALFLGLPASLHIYIYMSTKMYVDM